LPQIKRLLKFLTHTIRPALTCAMLKLLI